MSDPRRDAVAAAVEAANERYWSALDDQPNDDPYWGVLADAALAAIDATDAANDDTHAAIGLPKGVVLDPWPDDDEPDAAEPTDAEVDAARAAYYEYLYREDVGADYAMRAALIAARKART